MSNGRLLRGVEGRKVHQSTRVQQSTSTSYPPHPQLLQLDTRAHLFYYDALWVSNDLSVQLELLLLPFAGYAIITFKYTYWQAAARGGD